MMHWVQKTGMFDRRFFGPCLYRLACWRAVIVTCWLQVSLPVATVDGLPVGVGLIGPAGSDESLLAISKQLMHILLQR